MKAIGGRPLVLRSKIQCRIEWHRICVAARHETGERTGETGGNMGQHGVNWGRIGHMPIFPRSFGRDKVSLFEVKCTLVPKSFIFEMIPTSLVIYKWQN